MSINHTGSPPESQTQVIGKYTFLDSSNIYINPLSSQSTKPITSQTQNIHTQRFVSSILPLLKEHIRLGHAGIVDHSV